MKGSDADIQRMLEKEPLGTFLIADLEEGTDGVYRKTEYNTWVAVPKQRVMYPDRVIAHMISAFHEGKVIYALH